MAGLRSSTPGVIRVVGVVMVSHQLLAFRSLLLVRSHVRNNTRLLWRTQNSLHPCQLGKGRDDERMMGIKFQCQITSRELWNERLRSKSDLTFRTALSQPLNASNETFDIQVKFEVQVSVIAHGATEDLMKRQRQ